MSYEITWFATGLQKNETKRRQFAISILPDFLDRVEKELSSIKNVNVWQVKNGKRTLVKKFNWKGKK